MEYASLFPSAFADYGVPILNLAGVDVVDLLIAVELADPFRRAVVFDGHFNVTRSRLTYGQRRFVRIASCDNTLPAALFCGLFFGRSLWREPHCLQREGKK